MPLPVIAIDFGARPPEAIAVDAATRACSLALPRGECVDSRLLDDSLPQASVRLTWLDDKHQSILVEVLPGLGGDSDVALQRLDFSSWDPPLARWESIGLAIGTLVVPRAGAEPPPTTETADAPTSAPSRGDSEPLGLPWALQLRASLGTGFAQGSSTGIQFAGSRRLGTLPLFSLVTLDARHASADGVSGEWFELGAGFGAQAPLGSFRVGGAAQLMGQAFEASASSTEERRSDASTQGTLGLALSGAVVWPLEGRGGLSLGARVLRLRHPTSVWVGGQPLVENPELVVTGYVGLEVRF